MRVNLFQVSLTFRLASYGNVSDVSNTVTDTTMGSMEAEYESAPGLSVGTMTWMTLNWSQSFHIKYLECRERLCWTQRRSYRKRPMGFQLAP